MKRFILLFSFLIFFILPSPATAQGLNFNQELNNLLDSDQQGFYQFITKGFDSLESNESQTLHNLNLGEPDYTKTIGRTKMMYYQPNSNIRFTLVFRKGTLIYIDYKSSNPAKISTANLQYMFGNPRWNLWLAGKVYRQEHKDVQITKGGPAMCSQLNVVIRNGTLSRRDRIKLTYADINALSTQIKKMFVSAGESDQDNNNIS